MVKHVPVLRNEAIKLLAPQEGFLYVDATFGGGGYSQAILEAAPCRVLAFDCDPEALPRAESLEKEYAPRFSFLPVNFCHVEKVLRGQICHGIVFDLGVSSFQLEERGRGFSFQLDGPLDMRMSKKGMSAEEVVNTYEEDQLAQIIALYGEERYARRVASAIIRERQRGALKTTGSLAEVVRKVVPRQGHLDPATKTFQALRIFVNDELKSLQQALVGVEMLVEKGPSTTLRVVTVAFHSLEDRLIKNWMRNAEARPDGEGPAKSPHRSSLTKHCETPRVIFPSSEEIQRNPRSRSARLRAMTLSRKEKGDAKLSGPSQHDAEKMNAGKGGLRPLLGEGVA